MVERQSVPPKSEEFFSSTRTRTLHALFAAWLLSIGVDFLLHGGLFAQIYLKPDPFVLKPEQAFFRIPLGYLSFLVLTASLYWLIRKLGLRSSVSGFQLGLSAGLILWGAFLLGLYSISTIEWSMAVAWWIGQSLELGFAGAILAGVDGGMSVKRAWIVAWMTVIVCVVLTIVLQSVGWAPPMKSA